MIVAVPLATATTRPDELTVATLSSLLDHVTVRPVRSLPAASLSVTVSCVAVLARRLAVPGSSTTLATGTSLTATAAVPDWPPADAVIVAVPTDWPVTKPDAETVAMASLELDHVTVCPATVFPEASLGVAASCVVPPTSMVALAGATSTEATAGGSYVCCGAVASPPHEVANIAPTPSVNQLQAFGGSF